MKLKTKLFPYQKDAADKLIHLKVGALFMEMGTGKTRVALELMIRRFYAGKINHVIWLCPCSCKKNLKEDIKKHADIEQGLIDICGIETLSSSYTANAKMLEISKNYRCFLIVDESLLCKNPMALRSEAITRIAENCQYKLILNGTPISKNYADLFQQFYLLDWRILGYRSYWSFAANHLEMDDRYKHKIRRVLNTAYLTDKIAPFTVEIKKDDVLKLPEKQYMSECFSMTSNQCEHYEKVKNDFLSEELLLGGNEFADSVIIYRTFNALQQVTSGRRILSKASQHIWSVPFFEKIEENPRIQCLSCAIKNDVLPGEKVVIWCKFKHEISDIKALLEHQGCSVAICDGDLSHKKRNEELEKFKGPAQFLLANKSCAGFGLNLQFCHNAIFYNNDWDWATREQAEDRLHRIGQTESVKIIDIYAFSKIDVRILKCINSKESMSNLFKRELKNKNKNLFEWIDGKEDKLGEDWIDR
ncbi:MAG: DEAD/DEAH box helicase [Oscillospiraceae bacterium]|nr:DEAD/DEAH box helicase [Oscillospiraceae bacterium]